MKYLISLALLVAIAGLTACDQQQVQAQPKPQPAPQVAKVIHHFEPLTYSGGNLAIDTATGRKCRTWDWQCSPNDNPTVRDKKQLYGMTCSDFDVIPTCDEIASQP